MTSTRDRKNPPVPEIEELEFDEKTLIEKPAAELPKADLAKTEQLAYEPMTFDPPSVEDRTVVQSSTAFDDAFDARTVVQPISRGPAVREVTPPTAPAPASVPVHPHVSTPPPPPTAAQQFAVQPQAVSFQVQTQSQTAQDLVQQSESPAVEPTQDYRPEVSFQQRLFLLKARIQHLAARFAPKNKQAFVGLAIVVLIPIAVLVLSGGEQTSTEEGAPRADLASEAETVDEAGQKPVAAPQIQGSEAVLYQFDQAFVRTQVQIKGGTKQ